MAKHVKPIPEGYHSVTPYLSIKDAARALEFYKQAFGAKEVMRMNGADGRVSHAEIKIGDSIIMIAEENPQNEPRSRHTPTRLTVTPFLSPAHVDPISN